MIENRSWMEKNSVKKGLIRGRRPSKVATIYVCLFYVGLLIISVIERVESQAYRNMYLLVLSQLKVIYFTNIRTDWINTNLTPKANKRRKLTLHIYYGISGWGRRPRLCRYKRAGVSACTIIYHDKYNFIMTLI